MIELARKLPLGLPTRSTDPSSLGHLEELGLWARRAASRREAESGPAATAPSERALAQVSAGLAPLSDSNPRACRGVQLHQGYDKGPAGQPRSDSGAQPRHRREELPQELRGRIGALPVQPDPQVLPGQLCGGDPDQQLSTRTPPLAGLAGCEVCGPAASGAAARRAGEPAGGPGPFMESRRPVALLIRVAHAHTPT